MVGSGNAAEAKRLMALIQRIRYRRERLLGLPHV
jgi:hypothetical protein